MRFGGKLLMVTILMVIALSTMPTATNDRTALRGSTGPLTVLDAFPGSPTFGVFLVYWRAHAYSSHCPYGYLLRVPSEGTFELPSVWDLWRQLADRPSAPPAGVEIERQGFPSLMPPGPQGLGVPEGPFDGFVSEVLFQSSESGSTFGFLYEINPVGDSAYASANLVRAASGPVESFMLSSYPCL